WARRPAAASASTLDERARGRHATRGAVGRRVPTASLMARHPDGTYLGRLNLHPSDPESVANPNSPYGSPLALNSINNVFGRYGRRSSPDGIRNKDTTSGPMLFDDE